MQVRNTSEPKGFRLSKTKTIYRKYFSKISRSENKWSRAPKSHHIHHLDLLPIRKVRFEDCIDHRIRVKWMKWRSESREVWTFERTNKMK